MLLKPAEVKKSDLLMAFCMHHPRCVLFTIQWGFFLSQNTNILCCYLYLS